MTDQIKTIGWVLHAGEQTGPVVAASPVVPLRVFSPSLVAGIFLETTNDHF